MTQHSFHYKKWVKQHGVCWNADLTDKEKNIKRGISCIKSVHGRVMEWINIEFIIEDVSARCIRELGRHCVGTSYLQSSTRYVSEENGFNFYIPPKIEKPVIVKEKEEKNKENENVNNVPENKKGGNKKINKEKSIDKEKAEKMTYDKQPEIIRLPNGDKYFLLSDSLDCNFLGIFKVFLQPSNIPSFKLRLLKFQRDISGKLFNALQQ